MNNKIINGKISTGKTLKIVFPLVDKLIKDNKSFFVIDSKEEYLNEYYNKLTDYNKIIINLRNPEKSEGWNILSYAYNLYKHGEIDKAIHHLKQIGDEIFYEVPNQDPFWTNSATDFFIGTVFGLFEDAHKEEINLTSVNRIFNATDIKIGSSNVVKEYFKTKDPKNYTYSYASSTIFSPTETMYSILSVAKQKLKTFTYSKTLNQLFYKTTFNFDNVLSKKTAIFFIAPDENTNLNNLVSIFVNQLFLILFNKKEFCFILDNFDVVDNFSNLKNMLSSSISRNINFIIVTRNKENLEKNYGKYLNDLVETITISDKLIKEENNINTIKEEILFPKLTETKIKTFDITEHIKNRK